MTNLSAAQIRETVARAGYRHGDKVAARAIAGEPEANFVVFSHFRAQNPTHPLTVAYRASTTGMATAQIISHEDGRSHLDIPLMRQRCEQCQ